jgi:hypothetical protein
MKPIPLFSSGVLTYLDRSWQIVSVGLCLVLLVVSLSGCSAMRVSHQPATSTVSTGSVPGVPFYPKKARCRQEIVWFEPIYTLTLAALIPDKDGTLQSHPRGAVVLSRSKFMDPEVSNFIKLLNNPQVDVDTVTRNWAKVVALSDSGVLGRDFSSLTSTDRILAHRASAPSVYVDYADQYYVNAKVPLSGTAQLDAKVADDGSLSEASAQVENKTLDTILGALPISSVITGGLGLAGKGLKTPENAETFQLTVAVTGYIHTLAKFVDFPKDSKVCPVATEIAFADADEYKREEMTAPSDSADSAKSKDSKSSGSKDSSGGQTDKTTKSGKS